MTTAHQIKLDQDLLRAISTNNVFAVQQALIAGANPARLVDNPFLAGEQLLTGMHFAANRGSPEVMRLLLQAGALPSIEDNRGNTPLHSCISSPHAVGVWKVLCEYGADPAHTNHRGLSPRLVWERHYGYPPEEVEPIHAPHTSYTHQPSFTLPPPRPSFNDED